MPPKLQNRTFHIRRNSPHRLGSQQDHDREGVPPPIVSVAVGTAGYKRSWKWAQRMGEAGVLDRGAEPDDVRLQPGHHRLD